MENKYQYYSILNQRNEMTIVSFSFYKKAIPFPTSQFHLLILELINRPAYRDSCSRGHNQQREPFLQLSAPEPIVMGPTNEDGLALKLEALA